MSISTFLDQKKKNDKLLIGLNSNVMQLNEWQSQVNKGLIKVWGQFPIPGWLRTIFLWIVLPKFLVGAVAVIFDDLGRVLLFKHTYRSECPWGLPSGWLKKGEHAHKALEREVYEESGFQVEVLRSVVVGGDRSLQRLDLYYECVLKGGVFSPSNEVSQAKFFPRDEFPDCLEPFHQQVIDYTANHPEGSSYPDE